MKYATLSDLSKTGKGRYGIAASGVDYREDLPTYLRITDICDDGSLSSCNRVSVADEKADGYMLEQGDIVFARTGASVGRNYLYDQRDGSFAYAGFLIKFSLNEQAVNPRWVRYYCLSKQYGNWIQSFNAGSTRGNINAKTYEAMPIPLPDRAYQDAAVSILDAIEDKRRLNQRTNDYLASTLNCLFKEEILAKIDDSWAPASLLDIADYKNGLAMQKFRPESNDPGLPVLKIKELGQGSCSNDAERCRSDIDKAVRVYDGDLIFSWSGTLLLDFWAGGNAGLNQHLFKVTSNKYDPWFYYLWTNFHMRKFISLAKDRATTMGHIKRSALAEAEVHLPPASRMPELQKLFNPLVSQMVALKVESRKLAELRDALLPKLMSGEIDVSQVDLTPLNNHLSGR